MVHGETFWYSDLVFSPFQLNILYNVLYCYMLVLYTIYDWLGLVDITGCTILNGIFSMLQTYYRRYIRCSTLLPWVMMYLLTLWRRYSSYQLHLWSIYVLLDQKVHHMPCSQLSTILHWLWVLPFLCNWQHEMDGGMYQRMLFEMGDYSSMTKFTVLTALVQLSGILFVGWLPHTKDDLLELKQDSWSSKLDFICSMALLYVPSFTPLMFGRLSRHEKGRVEGFVKDENEST